MISINKKAPVKVEKSIKIYSSVDKVWKILTDINKWREWNPDIKRATLNGNLLPGTTFEWESGGSKIRSTLHTVESFEYIGWSGKAFGAYAIHNWKLTKLNGMTEVIVEESMEGFLMSIFRGFMLNTLEKNMENWLIFLKAEAEK